MDKWERMERTFDRVEARMESTPKVTPDDELEAIENEDGQVFLKHISKYGEILVDQNTKNPYIIYQDVRFDIEAIIEQEID